MSGDEEDIAVGLEGVHPQANDQPLHPHECICHGIYAGIPVVEPLALVEPGQLFFPLPRQDHRFLADINYFIGKINTFWVDIDNDEADLRQSKARDAEARHRLGRTTYRLPAAHEGENQRFYDAGRRFQTLQAHVNFLKDKLDRGLDHARSYQDALLNMLNTGCLYPLVNLRRVEAQRSNLGCEEVDHRVVQYLDEIDKVLYRAFYFQVRVTWQALNNRHVKERLFIEETALERFQADMLDAGGRVRLRVEPVDGRPY